MSKLTDKFKNVAIAVQNRQESFDVQRALFALGYRSMRGGREPDFFTYNYAHYVITNKICEATYGGSQHYENEGYGGNLITKAELFAAVEEHKQAKRDAKKASRKRKQLRKQGWIINTGVKPDGVLTELLFRDGEVRKQPEGYMLSSDFSIPFRYSADKTIVAYKLKPEKISIEELHTKVAKDIGKVPAKLETVPIEGEWITWNGGKCPVPKGTKVDVKYRDDYVQENVSAGVQGPCNERWAIDWNHEDGTGDIIAYRVVKESKPAVEPTTSDTNPKKQFGDKSIPLNLWPALASAYGALGLFNGRCKYGQSNFNATPVEASIYIAGAKRHLEAWAEGEEFDPADGVPNLGGVLANIAILLEARAAGTLVDDRKLGTGYLKEREALKEIVGKLRELHADKSPRHYTIADTKELK